MDNYCSAFQVCKRKNPALIINVHIDGLVQDCGKSIENALTLLQCLTKLPVWGSQ